MSFNFLLTLKGMCGNLLSSKGPSSAIVVELLDLKTKKIV